MNRGKKIADPNPNQGEVFPSQGILDVGGVVKRDIFRGTVSIRRIENAKAKRDFVFVTESDGSDALILFLAGSSESWMIDSGASFHATF